MSRLYFLSALAITCCPLAVSAATYESSAANRQNLSLTIYEQNQALVRDTRSVPTGTGRFNLVVQDVSEQIQPETLMVENNSRLQLSGATFNTALLSPENLMKAYVGKDVTVVHTNPVTGQEIRKRAKLLSMNGGGIVQIDGRIETVSTDRIVFDRVPTGLYPSPVLMLDMQGGSGSQQKMTMDYLTSGLSWKMDYTAVLHPHNDVMALTGWAILGNQSGIDYRHAKVQLMAGEPERASRYPRMGMMMKMASMESAVAASNDRASEEAFADYHLYTVPNKVDVLDKQSSRYRLLSSDQLKVVKEYTIKGNQWGYESRYNRSTDPVHAGVWLNFDNTKRDGLGVPLPGGIMRFYQDDRYGNRQLLGESTIEHTPVDGHVRLKLGDAFDVTMTRRQTAFNQVMLAKNSQEKIRQTTTEWELVLSNAKSERVTVKVVEPLPENGRIIEENRSHKKEDANSVVWQVSVPAKGKTLLRYKVQVN